MPQDSRLSFSALPPELVEEILGNADLLENAEEDQAGTFDHRKIREHQRWCLSLALLSHRCLQPARRAAYHELWAAAFGVEQLHSLLHHLDRTSWQPARYVSRLVLILCADAWTRAERDAVVPLLFKLAPRLPCLQAFTLCSDVVLPVTGDELLATLTSSQMTTLSICPLFRLSMRATALNDYLIRCPIKHLKLCGVLLSAPPITSRTSHVDASLMRRKMVVEMSVADFFNGSSFPSLLWAVGPSLHCLHLDLNQLRLLRAGLWGVDFSPLNKSMAVFRNAGRSLRHLVLDVSDMSNVSCRLPETMPLWLLQHLTHLELRGNFVFCLLQLFEQLPVSLVSFSAEGLWIECIACSFMGRLLSERSFMPRLQEFRLHGKTEKPYPFISPTAFIRYITAALEHRKVDADLNLRCGVTLQCERDCCSISP